MRKAWLLLTSISFVFLLLLSGIPLGPSHLSTVRLTESPKVVPASASNPLDESSVNPIHAAISSLQRGAGPSHGTPLACDVLSSPGTARCSATTLRPGTPSLSASSSQGQWTPTGVIPDGGGLIAFDSTTNISVYVAATGTWEYRGGVWWPVLNASTPSICQTGSLAYDSADGYMLYFGGESYCSTDRQTWAFSGSRWSEILPTVSPHAREYAALADDPVGGYTLLMGGENCTSVGYGFCNDTWSYRAGNWTDLTPGLAFSPSARYGASMSFDRSDSELILFGGSSMSGAYASPLNDTWAFRNGNWSRLNPPASPPPRSVASMTSAPDGRGLLLFGGIGTNATNATVVYNDTWRFYNGNWTLVAPQGSFPLSTPRSWNFFAQRLWQISTDQTGASPVLVGPLYPSQGQGLQWWSLAGSIWTNRTPEVAPPVAWQYSIDEMAYDPAGGYVLFFGGIESGPPNYWATPGTWSYANGNWTDITQGVQPSARSEASMVYDGSDGYVVLFGGSGWGDAGHYSCGKYYSSQLCGDTWRFSGSSWSLVSSSGGPSNRSSAGMVYDAADGYVVLQGGISWTPQAWIFNNDTWTYHAGSWTNITSTLSLHPGTPTATLAYDAALGRVVMQGDWLNGTPFADNETWLFSGGQWSRAPRSIVPSPPTLGRWSTSAVMFYDNLTELTIYIDPSAAASWTFDGANWTRLSIPSNEMPLPGGGATWAVYDGHDRYGFVVGSEGAADVPTGDYWTWTPPASELSATLTASQNAIDVGQSVTFSLTVAGETGSYTATFSGLPPGCAASGYTFSCQFNEAGLFPVVALISNSTGGVPLIASAAVTVNPPLSVSDFVVTDLPHTPLGVALNMVFSGGTPPYRFYYDFGDGTSSSSNYSSTSHVYDSAGTFQIVASVLDTAGINRTSTSSLGLSPPPLPLSVSVAASPAILPLDANLSLVAGATGGYAPYTYAWTNLPQGCLDSSLPLLTCHPIRPGVFEVSVGVSDAFGDGATSSASVIVASILNASLIGYGISCQSPTLAIFSAAAVGGWGAYTYDWSWGDGTSGPNRGPQVEHDYPSAGTYRPMVRVSDASNQTVTVGATIVLPSLLCAPSTSTPSATAPWWQGTPGWALLGGGVGVGVGVVGMLLMRRLRK